MKHNRLIEWLLARYHFTNSEIYQVLKAGVTLGIVALGVSRLLGNQRETKILALIVGLISAAFFLLTAVFLAIFSRCPYCHRPISPAPTIPYCMHCGKKLDDNQE